jgi:tetratricopeptide (TPR) repeat protein
MKPEVVVTAEELQKLLQNPKGKKVIFRREYILNPVAPQGTEQSLWDQFVEGQWQAMVRDILALANGNIKTTNKTGWLVIGADREVNTAGERDIFDTSHIQLYERQILEKVNQFSDPPLQDVDIEAVEIDGKQLQVIIVPKSPFVHETSAQLMLSTGIFDESDGSLRAVDPGEVYSARTVFMRRIEGISPASQAERRKLVEEKSIQSPYKRLVRRIQENPVISILSFILITALPTAWFLYNEVIPSFQPQVMSGEFNIAVAEMTVIGESGDITRSKDGQAVSEFLYTRLEGGFEELNLHDIRYEIWGPQQTGIVKGDTPEERSAAAQKLSKDKNADVIVYGVITSSEPARFSPEFYVDYEEFEQIEDVTGEHKMGSAMRIDLPFELTQMQVVENPALSARANALSLITIGLAFLSVDDTDQASNYFHQAEALDGWFKSAGKEVIYMLLGNAYGRQASIEKSTEYLSTAGQNYETALEIDPAYGRAKIGLAGVLYLMALGDPNDASFDNIDLEMLDQAEKLFEEASDLENTPESANISTKSAFGLGQIYFVKSQTQGDGWIERAKNEFNIVIEDYEAGDVRLREIVSHAYARIALIAWLEGDIDTAVEFYRKAIEVASPFFQGYYYASIGEIYTTANRIEEAREAYSEALRIAEFFGDEESANRYAEKLKALE